MEKSTVPVFIAIVDVASIRGLLVLVLIKQPLNGEFDQLEALLFFHRTVPLEISMEEVRDFLSRSCSIGSVMANLDCENDR